MTRLTQLPPTLAGAVDNVVAIKLALVISTIGRPRSDTAISELYEELRNEVRKDFICLCNSLLESGKARIETNQKTNKVWNVESGWNFAAKRTLIIDLGETP